MMTGKRIPYAAAALAALALGLLVVLTKPWVDRGAEGVGSDRGRTPAGAQSQNADATPARPGAEDILRELQSAYEDVGRTPEALAAFARRIERFVQLEATNDEQRLTAWDLWMAVERRRAEYRRERRIYEEYLAVFEKVHGRKRAAAETLRRGNRGMYRDRNYFDGRFYYRLLLDRYPQSDRVPAATLGLAHFYGAGNDEEEALGLYDEVIVGHPDAAECRSAYRRKAELLMKLRRYDEALALYDEYLQRYTDEDDQAFANFMKGDAYRMRDKQSATMAVRQFRLVAEHYPDHRLAATARQRIKILNQNTISDLGDFDEDI